MTTPRKPSTRKPKATKLTPQLAESIYVLLRRGHYMRAAAAYVGIGKTTLYRWLDEGAYGRGVADHPPLRDDFATPAQHKRAVVSWRANVAREKLLADFADGVELAQDYGEAWLLEQILAHAADPNARNTKWTAYMTILERTRRERWRRPSAVDSEKPAGAMPAIDFTRLSDDERGQLRGLLQRIAGSADGD
jgi:hypothetical protein